MVYFKKGLSKESRAELVDFCVENSQYFNEWTNIKFHNLSDETLMEFADYFERKGYQ